MDAIAIDIRKALTRRREILKGIDAATRIKSDWQNDLDILDSKLSDLQNELVQLAWGDESAS